MPTRHDRRYCWIEVGKERFFFFLWFPNDHHPRIHLIICWSKINDFRVAPFAYRRRCFILVLFFLFIRHRSGGLETTQNICIFFCSVLLFNDNDGNDALASSLCWTDVQGKKILRSIRNIHHSRIRLIICWPKIGGFRLAPFAYHRK